MPGDPIHAAEHNRRREALLGALENAGELTARELTAAVCRDPINQALLLPVLWSLVGWRNIAADLSRPLDMHSPLWLPDHMPRSLVPLRP